MLGPRELHRRISRTELDFEQALRAEGTVKLKEGLDVNSMGMDLSPSPAKSSFNLRTPTTLKGTSTSRPPNPSTPVVVPPTPPPPAGPSSARLPALSPTSSNDIFYGPDDVDHQTKRRSLYRSPGTSSSPDLATLLRKAKERGGVIGGYQKKEKRHESPPPLPGNFDRTLVGSRPRSSTSSQATPNVKGKSTSYLNSGDLRTPSSPEWVLTNSQSRSTQKDLSSNKAPKSSMRSKTTAFLGKMLGQSTVRERSKTNISMPATPSYGPSLLHAFAPPTPPIPAHHQPPTVVFGSPIADVFTRTPEKPLPPIVNGDSSGDNGDLDDPFDGLSIVLVEEPPPHPPPPDPPTRGRSVDTIAISRSSKRRSMSVSEFELKSAMTASSSITPLPGTTQIQRKGDTSSWDETTLRGILSEFKGELSQLDPVLGSSLDLRDPSTPSRRAGLARSKTDGLLSPPQPVLERHTNMTASDFPTPTLVLQPVSLVEEMTPAFTAASEIAPIIPPRRSSLQIPPVRSQSGQSISPRTPRLASSPLRARNGNPLGPPVHHSLSQIPSKESTRLRAQHRSTASSSEPSLIPVSDEGHALVSNLTLGSQQDLTTNDLVLTRFPSNQSPALGEESSDMELRGKELAQRCWSEDEDFLAKEKIAEWLGGQGLINKTALHYYVEFFDFSTLRLDMAFRRLCAKLYLKAETQQVDRILEEFSRRYWDCNPGCLFGSAGVVHAVSYSLLLLNTDLHVADLSTRMSRNQFVRNTLSAVQMQLQPSAGISVSDLSNDDSGSNRGPGSDGTETISRSKRSNSITSWNSISREIILAGAMSNGSQFLPGGEMSNGSTPSVQVPSEPKATFAYGRNWEIDMEALLKEIYNAIKSQQILQPLSSSALARSSMSSLSPGQPIMRNRSLRGPPDRLTSLKRGSIRGLQSILSAQSSISPYSSNSSIDGRVSPSPSFATSTHEAIYGSSCSFLPPALGFASNLSHTIIREAQEDDNHSDHSQESGATSISITDEELALLGAPWAKEGMLCRKKYWESAGKRAKDKAWLDVFVVIQKGELNMFVFGETGGSGSGVVGGGNWLENAQSVGTVHLSHSLAHSLPPPGYNRQRPYCMVLTLANGGVYFFQAGTEELVNEWVSTCNYWAARTSKEPLAGGVSNMEYGWNRVADPLTHGRAVSDTMREVDYSDTTSVRSGRSSRSKFGWRDGAATVRAAHSPWVERTFVNDWKPPLPPTVSSIHDEESQLEALQKHVGSMKLDFQKHNEFREPMQALYQPRSVNAVRAQSNWEKKSQYLLTEIVKYDSYIESLQAAMSLRLKKRGDKALEQALSGANPEDELLAGKGKWKGYPEEDTIEEAEEPPVTPASKIQFGSQLHKRETADAGNVDD